MTKMTDILTNPDQFFSELSQRDVNLKTPFAIVMVSAIIGAIYAMMMFRVVISSLPEEIAVIFSAFATISTISNLITPFISWVLGAAIFYAVSMLFKGDGSFVRVFEFVGYGFIPTIIATVVGLVTTMTMMPAIGFPLDNPELMHQTMMQHIVRYGPVITISVIIQFLLVLWSVVIRIFAVKHARNIGTGHAIITVLAVPAAFFLLWCILLICIIAAA
ncbi:MAG: Yip1 family protein [Euryarchaeota archaeon]|nr:Yip1 family protein [Euryarchaeota archaeon]